MKNLNLKTFFIIAIILIVILLLIRQYSNNESEYNSIDEHQAVEYEIKDANKRVIYLAGGCFWGVEHYFQQLPGIGKVTSGYANGNSVETSYRQLSTTDHAETVEIYYDISVISLEEILLRYFKIIDPTSVDRQGNDFGRQYRTGIYYMAEEDLARIEKIMAYEENIYGELAVEVEPLQHFVIAEDYHQDYMIKNPNGYCHINMSLLNEPLFEEDYETLSDEDIRKKLDESSYHVMIENGTERAYSSELNDTFAKGIYVDKITGEPLFSSRDKFESGCGWPAFSRAITTEKIVSQQDDSYGMNRIEVSSSLSGGHLGHVFDDGPREKGGLRYCINGLALEFIPLEKMDELGYSDYKLFVD